MVRELASREHTDPFGRRVRISRQTIDRWIRDWRAGGFDALVPNPRQCTPRTPAEVLELAVALRRVDPAADANHAVNLCAVVCFKDSKGGGRWRSAMMRRRCGPSGPGRSGCSGTN